MRDNNFANDSMVVMDPVNPKNNATAKTFRIDEVIKMFKTSY